MEKPERLGVERPEGLGHGDPRRARCLLIMGVLSWEHRGQLAPSLMLGRWEDRAGWRGQWVAEWTGCASGRPADIQAHTAGPGDRAGHGAEHLGKRRQREAGTMKGIAVDSSAEGSSISSVTGCG